VKRRSLRRLVGELCAYLCALPFLYLTLVALIMASPFLWLLDKIEMHLDKRRVMR